MLYEEFLETIKNRVSACCGEGDEVEILPVMKNNSTVKDALIIRRKDECIAPNIYLNRFYQDYQIGKSIEEIVDTILYMEANCVCPQNVRIDQFRNYSYIKERLHAKLVNTKRNQTLLEMVPHREYMDLSIVYYVLYQNDEDGLTTTLVHLPHMHMWGITEEELYEVAMENTFGNLGVEVSPIADILLNMLPEDAPDEMHDLLNELQAYHEEQMFVVSNIRKVNGAIAMLYRDFLKTFALEHGSFYIIPSSVHELIFLTKGENQRAEELHEMVRQVNDTEVPEEDILSEHVYFYDAQENSLQMAMLNQ